jgi:ATP-dependent Clp protease protease subunit
MNTPTVDLSWLSRRGQFPDDIQDFDLVEQKLRHKGIYYITGEIEEGHLLSIHQDILSKHLDPNWVDDIQLIINSIGGTIAEGWSLIDLLDYIRMDVRTVGIGEICSLGASLVAAGTIGKRVVTKNCCIMVHGFSSYGCINGTREQMVSQMKFVEQEHSRDVAFWIRQSKYKTQAEVEKNLLTGNDIYMTPEEGLLHGIVDAIVGEKSIVLEKTTRGNKKCTTNLDKKSKKKTKK